MKNIPPLFKFSLKAEGGTNSVNRKCNPLRKTCAWSARNAGAICPVPARPSAEIVRVECAKCRRECDLSGSGATLCGDRTCRVREMQARECDCPVPVQPSAEIEIVRVECAKCRRECDWSGSGATLCGDRACRLREMQARVRYVRFRSNPLRISCMSIARNAGESVICPVPAHPFAEGDSVGVRAALCGDCACREREMQARVRFVPGPRKPLRRSCVSSARNAYTRVRLCPVCAQPAAEVRSRGAVPLGSAKRVGVNAACCWGAG